jgi:hypothetical protein
MSERKRRHGLGAVAFGLALSVLACGCSGSDGPARYPVRGTVTYDGNPVPAGQIAFEPDAAKGNSGPASYVRISNGTFATARGEGTVGGPHVGRILGADGKASPESPDGIMLFSEYETTVDLPKAASTQEFSVPGTHR